MATSNVPEESETAATPAATPAASVQPKAATTPPSSTDPEDLQFELQSAEPMPEAADTPDKAAPGSGPAALADANAPATTPGAPAQSVPPTAPPSATEPEELQFELQKPVPMPEAADKPDEEQNKGTKGRAG